MWPPGPWAPRELSRPPIASFWANLTPLSPQIKQGQPSRLAGLVSTLFPPSMIFRWSAGSEPAYEESLKHEAKVRQTPKLAQKLGQLQPVRAVYPHSTRPK